MKALEHDGYQFETADGSFELLLRKEAGEYEPLFRLESWRVIVEQRADGKVETEATIKIWVDGERYVRTAEGNGPVHALDACLRAAITDTPPAPRRHLADELQGPHPRRDEGLGRDDPGADRLDRRRADVGLDRRLDEPHRRLVDGARRLARVRRAAQRRARPRDAGAVSVRTDEEIPLARPVLGEAEEQAVIEVLRSGQLSLGPRVPAFERAFAARLGVAHASAVSSGTAGLHLALRAAGVSDGDEVVTSPFSFVASANAPIYERARPVFADIDPRTLNLDPQAAAAAVTARTTAILPVHIFGYPADLPAFEALGLPIVEDACEALGAVHADGVAVGARGHPAVFGFYANKQLTTGEGGMVTTGDAAVKERIDSERNQGRAPDMGWLDHDRLGFNYRLSDIACAIGLAQLERLDAMLAGRARAAALYREALAGIEGLELPVRGRRRRSPRLVRLRRPAAARRRPRRDDPRAARARRAVQALPAGDPPDVLLPRDASATARASSRSARTSPRARSRCRSSPS